VEGEERRRVPQRSCIVCSGKRAKLELLRLALDVEARVCFDHLQHYPGRGCYVCPRPECLARLNLSHLQKGFRRSLPETAWNPSLATLEALQRSGAVIKINEVEPNGSKYKEG
jgi:predicted RNA-binding protein YlxR (DUF448 family)